MIPSPPDFGSGYPQPPDEVVAVVAVVVALGRLVTFVSIPIPAPLLSADSRHSPPNSAMSAALTQTREFERAEYSWGVAMELGIESSAAAVVVVVIERPEVVDRLDCVLFEAGRGAWVDEENTGGLNSASVIAPVSLAVLSRVLWGLRPSAVVE